MGALDGLSILITGGTGSFGKAFVDKVLREHNVKRLVVYSRDELKQFEMEQKYNAPNLRYFIGDVRDEKRLNRAFQGIDVVIHAAALKQVVAAEYNPIECIMTNVMGAENIINAAMNAGVKKVLALSTDKAVNPINLYGATKLCSDKLFIAANNMSGYGGCKYAAVRYGNVIGSRGSVVPVFEKQKASGAVTITDPRMTRFWLTIEQGVDFVIKSLGMMNGGEVFVPKIPSMRIVDLATAVAPQCEQNVIGIRPGEKLHEVLIPADEARQTYEYDDFYVITPAMHMWNAEFKVSYGDALPKLVDENFEYASGNNKYWVSGEELLNMLNEDTLGE